MRRLRISLAARLVALYLSCGGAAAGAQPAPVIFPADPFAPDWAQPAIFTDPGIPEAGVVNLICAEVVNEDPFAPWTVFVEFSVAPLGIGLDFQIVADTSRLLRAGEAAVVCQPWTPPSAGPWGFRARLFVPGFNAAFTERNLDLLDGLMPGVPSVRNFAVANPTGTTATISLGLIPGLPGWGLALNPDVIVNLAPGATQNVALTVTPPEDLPAPGAAIVDVQGSVGAQTIGGFSKRFGLPEPKGDMNCDGVIDAADCPAFLLAIGAPAGYASSYPGCPIENGDFNGDGATNALDLPGFRSIAPDCRPAAVPATNRMIWLLLAAALAASGMALSSRRPR